MGINSTTFGRALTCLALVALLLSVFGARPVSAQTQRYVDTTGTDTGACTDPTAPCQTIGYAINQAAHGDTINVAAGTYDGLLTIDKPLTLQGDPSGDLPRLTFPDTAHDGITIAADNVTLDNLWLYRDGHSGYNAIVSVPKGGTYPEYEIVHSGLTIQNCVVEGGRYGMYVSVEDMTVDHNTFIRPYRNGIVTAGITGNTVIRRNHFIGTDDTKQAVYVTTGPGRPFDSGTLQITHNTHTGGGHFFLVDYWGWDEVNGLELEIAHNSVDDTGGRRGVVFYAAYARDPLGFSKFETIVIRDNIFSNCGPAVYVDYQDWGGAPDPDDKTVPADDHILVHNNLTYSITLGADDTMDTSGAYGYRDTAETPSGASLLMFDLANNFIGDPLYDDPEHDGICFEFWALQSGSPALAAASDGTNIGAWQGTPPSVPAVGGTTMPINPLRAMGPIAGLLIAVAAGAAAFVSGRRTS